MWAGLYEGRLAVPSLLNEVAGTPGLIKPGFRRAVQTEQKVEAFVRTGLNPIVFPSFWCFRGKVNRGGAVIICPKTFLQAIHSGVLLIRLKHRAGLVVVNSCRPESFLRYIRCIFIFECVTASQAFKGTNLCHTLSFPPRTQERPRRSTRCSTLPPGGTTVGAAWQLDFLLRLTRFDVENQALVLDDQVDCFWGGDVVCVSVSAKQKQGIEDLLENILLVTFTEKATSELKLRIRQKIEQALDGDLGLSDAVQKKLSESLDGFDNAAITTIHGFCHSLLKDFPFETGSLFQQEIIDDTPLLEKLLKGRMRTDWPRRYGRRLGRGGVPARSCAGGARRRRR